jgi:hypothetical protein
MRNGALVNVFLMSEPCFFIINDEDIDLYPCYHIFFLTLFDHHIPIWM